MVPATTPNFVSLKSSKLLELHVPRHQNSPTLLVCNLYLCAYSTDCSLYNHCVLTDMTSTLDNSALSRQPLRPESGDSEGEEYGSGYDDEQCTQPVDPRPLTGNASSIPCHVIPSFSHK